MNEKKNWGKIALILTNGFLSIGFRVFFFEVSVSLINELISLMYMTMSMAI